MNNDYEKEIKKELVLLGIMPKIRGFIYFTDAIKSAVDNKDIICGGIINIYKKIGIKYNSKWQSVERSMRYAIEKIEYQTLEERFNYVPDVEKIKVIDLVLLISDKLRG